MPKVFQLYLVAFAQPLFKNKGHGDPRRYGGSRRISLMPRVFKLFNFYFISFSMLCNRSSKAIEESFHGYRPE